MDTTGMTDDEKLALWGMQREVFQRWLVGLSDKELTEIGKDVYSALDYRERISKQLDMTNLN